MLIPLVFTACAAAGYGFTLARQGALALPTRIWALICLAGSAAVGGSWRGETWAMRGASIALVAAVGVLAFAIARYLFTKNTHR